MLQVVELHAVVRIFVSHMSDCNNGGLDIHVRERHRELCTGRTYWAPRCDQTSGRSPIFGFGKIGSSWERCRRTWIGQVGYSATLGEHSIQVEIESVETSWCTFVASLANAAKTHEGSMWAMCTLDQHRHALGYDG